ncbi:MAG TPA: glycosyltransferase family 39 protein [Acetobacteraceae bacterium]|nr:glycosyltransferase family 39 protein [Acetobacteraceae bacterium]
MAVLLLPRSWRFLMAPDQKGRAPGASRMLIQPPPRRGSEDLSNDDAASRAGGPAGALRAILLFLVVAAAARAMGFVPAVIDTDEGLFIVQAREWLRGAWPLVAVWDMHPVGAPGLIALGMALMGESLEAVRMTGLIATVATSCALHAMMLSAGAPRAVGLAAGVLYAAHSVLVGGLITGTEILMAPFTAGAIAIGVAGAMRAVREGAAPGWGGLLAMGLLVGIGLTVKPVIFPMGCLAFALCVLPAWWRGVIRFGRVLAYAGSYALACLVPTLMLGVAYALHGAFGDFLDGSFLAPMRYSGGRLGWNMAARQAGVAVVILLWPFLLAGAGLALTRSLALSGWPGRIASVGLLWFAMATAAIVGPGMYYQHYFLIWIPPLAVLAALGAQAVSQRAGPALAPALLAGIVGVASVTAWQYEFAQRFQRGIGFHQPDPVREVAAILAREGAPGDSLFVANYHSAVYFLARAAVPTRYIFPAHLTGFFHTVPPEDMNAEISRILAAQPRFIVVDRGWWDTMHAGAQARIGAALAQGYSLVGRVQEERGPVEVWRRD